VVYETKKYALRWMGVVAVASPCGSGPAGY
jgi:hypothetical protein